ncbi:Rne/Rng family ribonuclease [Vannielia sp.]|uniref:Rne/Rng family ribonuclease n=1 Tax=Vannielia sp. TaxID=2813045 RepID=UPI00260D0C36|nr:Rne/Rng family ribonuclease [Vannielia sp.]MDF1873218.1 Rne/Rng family ribonuclease [Vannielia sp.]
MAKKMLIDATHAEETRVVVVDGNRVDEFDFETVNKRQLAGNIYLAKVTRVEPSLQAAFVDYGGNRHGFLAFSEIHPDYYQIPVADRLALLEEERAYAAAQAEEDEAPKKPRRRRRSSAKRSDTGDAVETREVEGMEVVDLTEGEAETQADAAETDAVTPEPEAAVEAPEGEAHGADADATGGETPEADAPAEAAEAPAEAEVDAEGEAESDDEEDTPPSAAERDEDIESVAEEDVQEEIRQPRKPRPKRYKIQEVVKVRQILLVQVVKEERGNKGAALTTYLSLAGRYCVLMPNTARGGGISRKITNAADRKKLKEIAQEIDVPQGAGLIVRTAGAKRTKTEIKRDYEYLKRLWEQIRELTLKSTAPAPIYEEGNLIKRSIRDLYSKEIDEVWVEGEMGYRTAKDFMKMIMPSHAKNVKLYDEGLPLFARYQVESYLAAMFNPTVQLKSGGYIVIGITEALVAIDVNSGRATKEGSIEETALKTNLEAAEEVARQLRLRDLAGLIVIDFIDMEERRNNAAVEKRFKDRLKTDRARIQVGRISGFGLMEMSRQRLRPGMLEATTQPCPACHGTGLLRSDDSIGLAVLRQIEEEGTRRKSREVLLKAPSSVINFLINNKREHIAQIEARYGLSVRLEADPHMISPEFSLEKFKTATRTVSEVTAPVISIDTSDMPDFEEEEEEVQAQESEAEAQPNGGDEDGEDKPRRKRRRRRRRRGGNGEGQNEENGQDTAGESNGSAEAQAEGAEAPADAQAEPGSEAVGEEKPKRRRRSRRKKTDEGEAVAAEANEGETTEADASAQDAPAEEPVAEEKPKRRRRSRKKADEAPAEEAKGDEPKGEESAEATPEAVAETPPVEAPEPAKAEAEAAPEPTPEPEPEAAPEPEPEPALETAEAAPEPEPEAKPEDPAKPKRKGWWSLGR